MRISDIMAGHIPLGTAVLAQTQMIDCLTDTTQTAKQTLLGFGMPDLKWRPEQLRNFFSTEDVKAEMAADIIPVRFMCTESRSQRENK